MVGVEMLDSILVVLVLSLDAFTASVAYGADHIQIPFRSALIVSGLGTAFLAVSVLTGGFLGNFIPSYFCTAVSVGILMTVGLLNFFQGAMKSFLRTKSDGTGNFHFKVREIAFVIEVFLDETKADRDHSKTLSIRESCYLGIALSIDSLATGFGIGFSQVSLWEIVVCSFVVNLTAILAGALVGRKMFHMARIDLSWLGGLMIIGIAMMKLL